MEELKIKAPAKINLHLEVLKKRDDGFHDISSLFTLIDLYDNIVFKRNKDKISLKETNPIENNIVLKAATLIKDLYSHKHTTFFHFHRQNCSSNRGNECLHE